MLQHYLRETTALSLGVLLACGPASAANAQAPADPGTPPAGALSTPAPDARGTATASAPQSAESPVAGEGQLGDIIVTAQRRSESLSRVGATVSVIGADELVSQGVDTAADLTRFVPGFQATQSYNGNPVYTLRGVGFNSPNANSTPPVGLYLDEAALPYPYMTLGTVFDLERVEVLKGPQGTLYGRNATGGLINFVSAKPTKEFHAGASAEIGNYDTYNFNGFISGPLADGLTARFAINSQNRNKGWQKSVTRDDRLGELHQNSMRGILALDRGGPFTASFTGSYWKRTGDTVAPQSIRYLPAAGNPLARTSVIARPTSNSQADWVPVESQSQSDIGIIRPAQLIDSRFYSATLKAAYAFSDTVQLASLTSYDNLRHRDATDLGGFQIAANFQDVTGKITSFSQELRLIGTSDNFNWSVGGYYAKDKSRQEQVGYNDQNNTVNTLRGVSATIVQNRFTSQQIARSFGNYDSRSNGDNEVLSGFANADYRFSDQLKLTVGGRYTEDKASQTACTYDYRGGNVAVIDLFYGRIFGKTVDLQPGQCYTLEGASSNFVNGAVQSSQKQHNFAWKANLDFTPTPTTLLYGNISRGYKAGGFPLIAASRSTQFAPIKQEELTAYELGTKLGLFDRAVQLNLSAFYYDYKNKQVFGRVADLVFSTLARIDNIPKSREYGVEGDVTWQLSPVLRVNVAGVYLNSKIKEYSSFDQFSTFRNLAGRPYNYTPKFQGNALVSYDQPLTDKLRINSTVSVSYQSKSSAAIADLPDFRIKSYALVGATVGLGGEDDRWQASVYVQNLFNTYYWNGVESATDSVFRFAGMPRQGGIRVALKY